MLLHRLVLVLQVWFKNRRAKCRQQQKQQQHSGGDSKRSSSSSVGGGASKKTPSSSTPSSHPLTSGGGGGLPGALPGSTGCKPSLNGTTSVSSAGQRDSPYLKPIIGNSPNPPTINSPYGASSIWSPAAIDGCLESRNYPPTSVPAPPVPPPGSAASGTGGGAGAGSTPGGGGGTGGGGQPSWGQGYYYSNMDYLGPGAAQLNVVQDNNLDSVWPKREDPTWFYNSSSWERK